MKGKKQYGYLPKRVKKTVDEIVDQMARLPPVQKCYDKWLELQQEVNEFYSDKPMERTPLSQQKEFRAIHNAVIQIALQVNRITFEDRNMAEHDEPDDSLQTDDVCWRLWAVIRDDELPLELRDRGIERLRTQAEGDNPYAQFLLGRLYRDGPLLTPDWVEARHWFEQAAQSLPDAQYALGKLLLTDDVDAHDREQGIRSSRTTPRRWTAPRSNTPTASCAEGYRKKSPWDTSRMTMRSKNGTVYPCDPHKICVTVNK